MTVSKSAREGTNEDNVHIYEMDLKLLVMKSEEENPKALANVASAVKTLLEDSAFEWLLEAIGHPTSGALEVVVTGREVLSIGPAHEHGRVSRA